MKNYYNLLLRTVMTAALISTLALTLAGCSHDQSADNPPAVSVPTSAGGATIATNSGTATIPPQVAKMPGYKPPSPYLAAMIAKDQARTNPSGQ